VITKTAEIINTKRLMHARLKELENYREAINQNNFVIRLTSDGTIIDINKDLKSYFNTHGATKQITSITDLFTAEDSAEILKYATNYKILTKTISLQLSDERFTILFSAFASKLEENNVREISVIISDITPILKDKDEMINRL
jgi:hypothetical protein